MMRRTIDRADAKLAVAKALVQLFELNERNEPVTPNEVQFVVDQSGIPLGYVVALMGDFGIEVAAGEVVWKSEQRDQVEAYVDAELAERDEVAAQGPFNSVHIHGGQNIQASAGGHGDQHMTVTVEQVLNALEKVVRGSEIPPEKKNEALSMLKGFAKTAGDAVIKAAVELGGKALLGP